jgi:hypothetical protein
VLKGNKCILRTPYSLKISSRNERKIRHSQINRNKENLSPVDVSTRNATVNIREKGNVSSSGVKEEPQK